MKQLKIVVDNYDNVTGLINVSFNQEILIEPQSEIAMDKFSMQISEGLTDNFEIPNQIVLINTNTQDTRMPPSRGAIVPSGTYTNISTLLTQMTQSFNTILISDMLYTTNTTPDNGLFFRCWLPSAATGTPLVNIGYGSNALDYTIANYSDVNMDFTGTIPNSTTKWVCATSGTYSMQTTSTTPIIAGALDIRFSLDLNANNANNTFTYGIILNGVVTWGFQKTETQLFIINNTQLKAISIAPFLNHSSYTHQFFVANGTLQYQIVNVDEQVILFQFNGFNFSQVCGFGIEGVFSGTGDAVSWNDLGNIFQPNLSLDTFGVSWNYDSFTSPEYLTLFPLTGVAPSRVIELDFNAGQVLQTGLGFVGTVFDIGNSTPATTNKVSANDAFGFADFYDLALQIPSLQIESYIASADRQTGGRINNICYFVPIQASSTSTTIYTYDNKELVFVTISNRERVNMNSMQFRVVYSNDPTGRTFVRCNSMSFNLYIKERPSL